MPLAVRQMTPVVARRGRGVVHVTSLNTPSHTACGKKCSGWVIAPANSRGMMPPITCHACNSAIFYPVDPDAKDPK